MLRTTILLVASLPVLSGCLTMEPVEFSSGHPASTESSSMSEPRRDSVLTDYSLPKPDHPLGESEKSSTAMKGMDHSTMGDMPTMKHDATSVGSGTEPSMESPPVATKEGASVPGALYTCPMHPEVVQEAPGRCPICDMRLIPKTENPESTKGEKKDE